MDALLYTLMATGALAIAFYVGRWVGIKFMMNQIEKELTDMNNDLEEPFPITSSQKR